LKRKGEKGSGQWQRLSWEQALDEVAEKLDRLREQFGAETLAFTHGTRRTYHWDERRFFNLFGSPNVCGANNICMCPSNAEAEDFPLVLITGSRFMPMYHSEHRQIEPAREKRPDPVVTLNPETAASLGLGRDEWIRVETPHGSILMRLKLSDRIDPRMADADHGWWFPERRKPGRDLFGAFESNANVLCPDHPELCSPEIGSWPLTGLPCRISRQ